MDHLDTTAIIVALIAAVASVIGGWFAYKAALRTRTTNGHTAGELLEQIAEKVSWLMIAHTEHITDQELHRIEQRTATVKHDTEQTEHIKDGP